MVTLSTGASYLAGMVPLLQSSRMPSTLGTHRSPARPSCLWPCRPLPVYIRPLWKVYQKLPVALVTGIAVCGWCRMHHALFWEASLRAPKLTKALCTVSVGLREKSPRITRCAGFAMAVSAADMRVSMYRHQVSPPLGGRLDGNAGSVLRSLSHSHTLHCTESVST
jgi:hypothetical protein